MRTGKYELVVIWWDNDTQIFEFDTEEVAEEVGNGYTVAFGNQVKWWGVRPQIVKGGDIK